MRGNRAPAANPSNIFLPGDESKDVDFMRFEQISSFFL